MREIVIRGAEVVVTMDGARRELVTELGTLLANEATADLETEAATMSAAALAKARRGSDMSDCV